MMKISKSKKVSFVIGWHYKDLTKDNEIENLEKPPIFSYTISIVSK
jgi:hypothetical protein